MVLSPTRKDQITLGLWTASVLCHKKYVFRELRQVACSRWSHTAAA